MRSYHRLLHPVALGNPGRSGRRGAPAHDAGPPDAIGAERATGAPRPRCRGTATKAPHRRRPRAGPGRSAPRGSSGRRQAMTREPVGDLTSREYKYGFVTEIEADTVPRGLSEEIIRMISALKHEPDFMLEWR